ncbi:pullulanase [Aerococcus urinaehominis]|uniref:Pullulanase n=1 Tax=Aerococcus urinaehominis TaxID=128944 RepID=A0A0X8FLL0_9LACT|nr:type I pullulanase [Aerococcus urinaehominis]AMB99572.1 pullulanase [Aerococcus urinaehominis]SDM35589.1 pullulanase [Aerococcus urinaehominis]
MREEFLQPVFDLVDTVDPALIRLKTRELMHDPKFDQVYGYAGELGVNYHIETCQFRLWAPTALAVELLIYDDLYGDNYSVYEMLEGEKGTYYYSLDGDWHNTAYMYRLYLPDGATNLSVDPYAKACTANGERGVILDLERAKPQGWYEDRPPAMSHDTDVVIYEASVRDFTAAENSGVIHRGKFLGMTEEGTKSPQGRSTGLDYLVDLGVTHVQWMPLADFATVDELDAGNPENYNWGYDPLHYNIPDGSFATDPKDPMVRLSEMRQMVMALHKKGIRVIMDVVYNHVYQTEKHPFGLTVPGYYFRENSAGELSNGTGVGNDTASQRFMMRRYIVDSVVYWAKEFHIDGFRFDLMGIHDVDTMNAVRRALDEIDPSIFILGEGWHLDTRLDSNEKASMRNAYRTPRVAYFNDKIRDAVKGSDYGNAQDTGFATGKFMTEQQVLTNFAGGYNLSNTEAIIDNPQQMIQYIAAHDNYTLYDKILLSNGGDDENKRHRRQMLATSIILLAQGVPFIHSGQEMYRTKNGIRDSYNSPEWINQIDWSLRDRFATSVDYISQLIRLRLSNRLFNLDTFGEVRAYLKIFKADYQIIGVHLAGHPTSSEEYVLIFNGQDNNVKCWIPEGEWEVIVRDLSFRDGTEKMSNLAEIEALSTLVLKRKIN